MAITASELQVILRAKDEASKAINQVNKSAGGLGKTFGTLGKIAGGVALAGIAAGGAAIAGLGAALLDCTKEAVEAQPAHAKLAAILANTGKITGVTVEQAEALATKFQGLARFEDEATIAAQSVLGTFTSIGKDVFPATTEAVLNLAEKMAGDATGAAEMLARAMGGDQRSLLMLQRQIGPFTQAQQDMLAKFAAGNDTVNYQKTLLDALNTKIGGLAVAMGNTAKGQGTIFNNLLSDIKETIGNGILPALTNTTRAINEGLTSPGTMGAVQGIADAFGRIANIALPAVAGFITETLIPRFNDLMGVVAKFFSALSGENRTPAGRLKNLGEQVKTIFSGGQLPGEFSIGSWATRLGEAIGTGDWSPVLNALGAQVDSWLSTIFGRPVDLTGFIGKMGQTLANIKGWVTETYGLFFENLADTRGFGVGLMEAMNVTMQQIAGLFGTPFSDKIIEALQTGDWSPVGAAFRQAMSRGFGEEIWDPAQVMFEAAANARAIEAATKSGAGIGAGIAAGLGNFLAGDLLGKIAVGDWIIGLFTGQGPSLTQQITKLAPDLLNGVSGLFFSKGQLRGLSYALAWAEALVKAVGGGMTTWWASSDYKKGLEGAWAAISKAVSEIDWAAIGIDIVGGIVEGITGASGTLKAAVDALIAQLPQWARTILGISSPSKVFAQIGKDLMLGLMQGMRQARGYLDSDTREMVTGVFRTWMSAMKTQTGYSGGKASKILRDWFDQAINSVTAGAGESLGQVMARVMQSGLNQLKAGLGPTALPMVQQFMTMLGGRGNLPATGGLFGAFDKIMEMAGTLGGLGSAAATRYQAKVVDPMKEQLSILEEQLAAMQVQKATTEEQATLVRAINLQKKEIAKTEGILAALAKQQSDLAYLQSQADLLKMIRENGLNVKKVLGDLKLGINADPQALIQAMTRGLQAAAAAGQKALGLSAGGGYVGPGISKIPLLTNPATTRANKNTEGRDKGGVTNVFYLTANYAYQSPQSLIDQVKGMTLVYS